MPKKIFSFAILLFLFAGCGKGGIFVPDVSVNYRISVAEFSIRSKNGILMVPDQGVAGLLIVRTALGYAAFDRCSSVHPENRCQIVPDDNGITATDPCTGAKFLLTDGSPQKAPAVRNLKSYRVSTGSDGFIQVSN